MRPYIKKDNFDDLKQSVDKLQEKRDNLHLIHRVQEKRQLDTKMIQMTEEMFQQLQPKRMQTTNEKRIDIDTDKCSDEESKTNKPNHSYISLIANAILSSNEKRLVLSDIYNYVLENFTYFNNKGPGWRNSIRHNLSLNECFIKAGRSPNGKGHYWTINPANYEDFSKGDFRRRRAQRRARRALTYYESPEQIPPFFPSYTPFYPTYLAGNSVRPHSIPLLPSLNTPLSTKPGENAKRRYSTSQYISEEIPKRRKRAFDVESLLKDDETEPMEKKTLFGERNDNIDVIGNNRMHESVIDKTSLRHSEIYNETYKDYSPNVRGLCYKTSDWNVLPKSLHSIEQCKKFYGLPFMYNNENIYTNSKYNLPTA